MHPRIWVYRRNLSNSQWSFFCSNENLMLKAGCCASGILGLIFLGLAVLSLFTPQVDRDRKLFLSFVALCSIFLFLCLMYCCIPWYNKFCRKSNYEEEEDASSSLFPSKDNTYEEVSGKNGISTNEAPRYQDIPSYQAGPSYQEFSSFSIAPCVGVGGPHPGLAPFRPLANYEGVFAHQQIPIYQQDLIEPQLPPYSHAYKQCITVAPSDIYIY